jgi:hypothetical protein
MFWFAGGKRPRIILAAMLVVALGGTFSLQAAEGAGEGISGEARRDGILSAPDQAADWLALDPSLMGNAGGCPAAPHNGAPRFFPPPGAANAGPVPAFPSSRAGDRTPFSNIKTTILLKLRI